MNGFIRSLAAAFAVLLGMGGIAHAEEDGLVLSGNVTLATDYRFRGISQLDNSPAIQGGFDLETEAGVYIGIWGSNIGFGGGGSQIEIDAYAGYVGEMTEDVSYDVGFVYYGYPQDDLDPDADYYEVYGSVSFMDATVGLNFSPDYFAETDTFIYVYGDYGLALGDSLNVGFHAGWNQFEDSNAYSGFFGVASGDEGYLDWSVTLATEAVGVEWALAYVDTSVSHGDCFGSTSICGATLVASLSKSL